MLVWNILVLAATVAATLIRPEKLWYLSELADFLHTRPSSLQRELAALVKSGILEQRRDGRRTLFAFDLFLQMFGTCFSCASLTVS